MTEKPTPSRSYVGYEAAFAEWATAQGWDVTKRGWPDFICRRDGAIMAVEVKGGNDELTPEQIDTLDDLARAGLPVYVYYHGLRMKRWRKVNRDSVASLKAEISDLHELIRKVIQQRDEMVPGINPKVSLDWTFQDELEVVIGWCNEQHAGSHRKSATRMTLCAWIYFLRKQERQEWDEIASIVGESFPQQMKGLHRKACRAVERRRYDLSHAA